MARRRLRVYEVGVSYFGRTYAEGKKVGWRDGIGAIWCLLKYAVKVPWSEAVPLPVNHGEVIPFDKDVEPLPKMASRH